MPRRDWRLRITAILGAIAAVQEYTRDMDYPGFAADRKTIDAVLRNVTVIGEAASRVPQEIVEANPEIPWRDMCDMRNILIHEYFGISTEILWDTLTTNLPPLVAPLRRILETSTD